MAAYPDKRVDVPELPGIFRRAATEAQQTGTVFYSCNGNNPVLIGYLDPTDQTKMTPNDNYLELFKDEWVKKYGHSAIKPIELRFGMYAATKVIVEECQLRKVMEDAFGSKKTDKLLDYAMYSILFQSDITSQYESRMSDQVLFSGKLYSDSTYSNLFEKGISNDEIILFKKQWALHCKANGMSKVWLCIDGSNEDCKCKGVEIAEKGKAKSKKNTNIISFTYAVSVDGYPVTFNLYRGGLVDAKAMKDIIDFLEQCKIEVEGVILDRGYCDTNAIEYLNEHKIEYVIMIKGEPAGYKEVADEQKNAIKNDAKHLVKKTHLYAAQKDVQLFGKYAKQDHVTIFYDFLNGAERLGHYLDKVYAEIDRLEALLEKDTKAVVSDVFKHVLNIDPETNAVCVNTTEIQKHIDDTGIYGIAHSQDLTPYEVHQRYSSRNVSEKQYSFVKTQLGYGTGAHVHFDAGTRSKYCLGFISSIIRYHMEQGADKIQMAATSYFRELNLMTMLRVNKVFYYTHTEKAKQLQMFTQLGKKKEYLDDIVADVNKRMNGYVPKLVKKKPGPKPKQKTMTRSTDTVPEPVPKLRGKPGPKPGFKRADTNMDGSKRQRPGPKPGSKKGIFNKDGTLRQKPGPKMGSHHTSATTIP
ncbi:MAG: transposase [Clostridia bacterium]|nr:transposase [Clostridia bacterium]